MSRRPAARLAHLAAPIVLVGLAGCSVPSFGMPEPITEQGGVVERLYSPVVATALVVGAVVWGLTFWSVVRYRRRNDTLPTQVAEHIPIEIVYTVVPIIIVVILFVAGSAALTDIEEKAEDPDVTIAVQGFQWSWQFTYDDEDVVVSGDGAGTQGPELVLPVDQTVRLELVTEDVNHSFWVPRFLSKRDLIPGVDNEVDVTPTEEGTYVGRCAEFCGLDHWRMNFVVRIVSAEEFERWVADNAGDDQAVPPANEAPTDEGPTDAPPADEAPGDEGEAGG